MNREEIESIIRKVHFDGESASDYCSLTGIDRRRVETAERMRKMGIHVSIGKILRMDEDRVNFYRKLENGEIPLEEIVEDYGGVRKDYEERSRETLERRCVIGADKLQRHVVRILDKGIGLTLVDSDSNLYTDVKNNYYKLLFEPHKKGYSCRMERVG